MSRVAKQPTEKRRDGAHPKQARTHQEWVSVSSILVDRTYQRPINTRRVTYMVGRFDPDAFGTITLSRREDNEDYVLDGQHRLALMEALGWSDQKVPALVYTGLTHEEEARIFRLMNGEATAPRAFDLFRARITEGEPTATAIVEILQSMSLSLRLDVAQNGISATSALEQVYNNGGPVALANALRTIKAGWAKVDGTKVVIFNSEIIKALGVLYSRYHTLVDTKRLETVFTRTDPHTLIREGRTAAQALSASSISINVLPLLLVNRYNQRLGESKQLPSWETRTSKAAWRPLIAQAKAVLS